MEDLPEKLPESEEVAETEEEKSQIRAGALAFPPFHSIAKVDD